MARVVVLPGLDGNADLRREFADCLEPAFDCTLTEFPPGLAGGYTDFRKLVEPTLPTDDEFVLVGESFSGPLAIQVAASKPKRLVGLVLCASFAVHPLSALGFATHAALPLPPRLLPDAMLGHLLLGRWCTPERLARLRAAIRRVSPSAIRARLIAAANVDCRPFLKQIDVPFLYLQASADRIVSASAARLVQRHCPAVEVRRVDAPHAILLAAPQECAGRIAEKFG